MSFIILGVFVLVFGVLFLLVVCADTAWLRSCAEFLLDVRAASLDADAADDD